MRCDVVAAKVGRLEPDAIGRFELDKNLKPLVYI
jgi:hypothetical protein